MTVSEPLRNGVVLEGVVTRITNFGAFLDLGGIEGLLHVSQISWRKITHPRDVLAVGERLKVIVLKYNPLKKRVSLGRKQLLTPTQDSRLDTLQKYSSIKVWERRYADQDAKLRRSKLSSAKKDIYERAGLTAKQGHFVSGGLPSLGKKK